MKSIGKQLVLAKGSVPRPRLLDLSQFLEFRIGKISANFSPEVELYGHQDSLNECNNATAKKEMIFFPMILIKVVTSIYPVNICILLIFESHVKWNHSHADIFSCFLVHFRHFKKRVILFLPSQKR